MQRWEYKVVSLRDQQYTVALNEFGRDGWELVSVISEPLEVPSPDRGRGIPLPRALGRIEEARDKLTKLGAAEPDAGASAAATSRLLWVFRRPLSGD
jgi:Domain of unknown function (DUF4177)